MEIRTNRAFLFLKAQVFLQYPAGKAYIWAEEKLKTRTMAQYPCENCKFRAHYDKDPKSVLGRFWRWHINFCPGFKAYFTHQDEDTKAALREKYDFRKYQ